MTDYDVYEDEENDEITYSQEQKQVPIVYKSTGETCYYCGQWGWQAWIDLSDNYKGTALTWNDGLNLISENKNNFNKNNFFQLKYEDLLSSPESIVQSLCKYVNVDFEIEMLEFYKPKTVKEISNERLKNTHENTQKPILKNNFNKYLNSYSKNEIAIFERFSKENLLKFNYKTNENSFKISNTLFTLNNVKYFFQHNINLLILNLKIVVKRIINKCRFSKWNIIISIINTNKSTCG